MDEGISYTDAEIEEERVIALADIEDRIDKPLVEIERSYNTGMGMHEALHASYMITEMVSQFLLEHPVIAMDDIAWKHAHNAHTALFNLYQRIGAVQNDILVKQEEALL